MNKTTKRIESCRHKKALLKSYILTKTKAFLWKNIVFFFHWVAFVGCMHTCTRVCLCVCLFVWSFICSLCAAVLCFVCANVFFCAFFFNLSRIFTFSSPKKSDFQINHNTCTKKGKRRERKWESVSVCTRLSNFFFLLENVIKNRREENNIGYGHTKRKAPLLARSVKLSLFGLG